MNMLRELESRYNAAITMATSDTKVLGLKPLQFYQFLFDPAYRPGRPAKPHYVFPQNAFLQSQGRCFSEETKNWQETQLPEDTLFFLLSEDPFFLGRRGGTAIALKCIYQDSVVFVPIGSIMEDDCFYHINIYVREARKLVDDKGN